MNVSLITLFVSYVVYVACALTLISASLLTSARIRAPFSGVGCTSFGM